MTSDKNFKMSPTFKAMVALTKGPNELRGNWKRMFIDAQLNEESARRASLKSKDKGGRSRGAVAPE